jgi:glycosyltransferase involved in cell wall biosynthesis
MMDRVKGLSGVIITYNRIDVVETCLNAARIVCDELIVVDKSSTDGTAESGARIADRLITVPWSPAVEETRAYAMGYASGEWILRVEDDECLNAPALIFIAEQLKNPVAQVYNLPIRHYILGRHDPEALYCLEGRPCLFKKGTMRWSARVHGGVEVLAPQHIVLDRPGGPAIEHFSHRDTSSWIEKANRYTSCPDRCLFQTHDDVTPVRMMEIMKKFMRKVPLNDNGYKTAVASLRAVYGIIDAVKHWEEVNGIDGAKAFREACDRLNREYAEL